MTQPLRLPAIDLLRGLAMLMVFSCHFDVAVFGHHAFTGEGWLDHPSWLVQLARVTLLDGDLGVSLFFVVSGLCIRLSQLSSREFSLPHFYWRRLWRIYPPYLLALVVFLLIRSRPVSTGNVVSHLFLVHNFSPAHISSIYGPFWSLALEFQVYLLYPVLLVLHERLGAKITCFLLVVMAVASDLLGRDGFLALMGLGPTVKLVSLMPTRLWFTWYCGFLVADRISGGTRISWLRRLGYLAAAWLFYQAWFNPVVSPLKTVAQAWVLMVLTEEVLRLRLPANRVIRAAGLVGVASYSMYLYFDKVIAWLLPPIAVLFPAGAKTALFFAGYPLVFAATLGAAYLLHRFVELPTIALGAALYRRYFPGSLASEKKIEPAGALS